MELPDHPISRVEWVSVNDLTSNDYNPNLCGGKERRLLKFSMLRQGWIQPILCDLLGTIIDGFHRFDLVKTDAEVYASTGGKVPVVKMDLTEAERKLLTVRINRAKGVHVACKMHDLVTSVVQAHGYTPQQVAKEIGASMEEINILLTENVFERKRVNEVQYSRSWNAKPNPKKVAKK